MSDSQQCVDLLVIGGGINGVGIANDAAGRGLSVVLCEQGDLAQATSSSSSKLIHGGLRYLEHFEFSLVRKALQERELLMKLAPHLIYPLEFIMPHDKHLRPSWLIRIGLFLYDRLGGKSRLPKSLSFDLRKTPIGNALKADYEKAYSYYDCWVDDARLVVANAQAARDNGASILTQTQFVSAKRNAKLWQAELIDANGNRYQQACKMIVNAAGPWVANILDQCECRSRKAVRLVKGSHIIVPRLFAGDHAFILQNIDKRIVFAIPYEEHYTLVGTTDVDFNDDPLAVSTDKDEQAYLCALINRYFKQTIKSTDIVWSYSGVRPLYQENSNEDASSVTRDYSLELNTDNDLAPILSVFGGKITTYRKLAEHVLQKIKPYFAHCGDDWTATTPLPGGDFGNVTFTQFVLQQTPNYPWLNKELLHRYASSYGNKLPLLLKNCRTMNDLGKHFGAGLYQVEVEYLCEYEWAHNADDVLWRRSKLGLHMTAEEKQDFKTWFALYMSEPRAQRPLTEK